MNARRMISLACLVVFLPRCMHWVPYEGPWTNGPPGGMREVRVTTTAGQQFTLAEPFVDGPDYVGEMDGFVRRTPADSIAVYEVKDAHVGKTIALVVGVVAVLAVVIAVGSALEDIPGLGGY